MNKFFTFFLFAGISFVSCTQNDDLVVQKLPKSSETKQPAPQEKADTLTIEDYFSNSKVIDERVDKLFSKLSDEEKVAQLIMPAMGRLGQTEEVIMKLVAAKKIGGVLMLNGTKEQFTKWIADINAKNAELGVLPFLYSADAEPSLVNRKITGSTVVKKAAELTTEEEVRTVAQTISKDLNEIGINYNFAPVSDMASNSTVGYRGFGKDPKNIVPFSWAFIEESSKANIISTAKHFPGHGLVSGDTHKALQVIDGELKELATFKELAAKNVPSIMIGHLAVKNNPKYNTNGLPATVSPVIVTDLLRKELNYKGLVVTDAMNMGGVTQVPNVNTAVIEAGCDILLMPLDAEKAHTEILKKYQADTAFKAKADEAAKRVIRMKLCLGLM
ncbi:glycoside hydrolase family 3 protein [Crocinitomicaceae bacterium CZZ-1]|uniref:beta-N-acetylhexosaminidase n=1 Tax=Taishania pollutisoli TaxID=2766479 RepID=A0A8J6PEL8_9FLAO|nr:glycoside hydrolase family 3 N-terminal domain-containing protein [Taishania pollutisoli]MBC9813153.1 glycoside hydrolase family 3 protein [Taishania pollutisoli]